MTQELQFRRFDPSACGFPKPRVPVLPTWRRHSLAFTRRSSNPVLPEGAASRSYVRGRYALADAMRLCGVVRNTSLLAPAYHCRTMLDPALHLGAEVVLYPLLPDLTVDLAALSLALAQCDKPAKALVVTHFFGFVKALDQVLAFCRNNQIFLIEDCCHCTPQAIGSGLAGRMGDYSVWSPYKFHPCEDGGTVQANRGAPLPTWPRQPTSLASELKAVARALRNRLAVDPALHTDSLAREVARLASTPMNQGTDLLEGGNRHSSQYDPTLEGRESLVFSRWMARNTDHQRLARLRRQHYEQWVEAVARLPHCHAFHPTLAPGCVPYMFPLYVERPDVHFFLLKHLGVPVWRWDDMAVSGCTHASDYRLKLLHLPCHQELSSAQMAWMTTAVVEVMTYAFAEGAR